MKELIEKLINQKDKKTLIIWATDCAEHILHYFEEKYPSDDRPRKAIEIGRSWIRAEINCNSARNAASDAHAAARDVIDDMACAAARIAGQACSIAHSAGHAMAIIYYTTKYIPEELDWQYSRLLMLQYIK